MNGRYVISVIFLAFSQQPNKRYFLSLIFLTSSQQPNRKQPKKKSGDIPEIGTEAKEAAMRENFRERKLRNGKQRERRRGL